MSLLQEFKDFIAKGNVIDLAVAFVIGVAFSAVVTALVTDIISPLIGIPGHVDFAGITYTVNGSTFLIGAFIDSVIAFISVALAVFFFIIKPLSKLKGKPKPTTPDTKDCPYCLSKIPIKATRCAYCTSILKK